MQQARTVILCGYTFENVRLLLLSGDQRHPGGLGNNVDQLGKHFMTKMWADVYGFFPDVVFNKHTGPAAQMWSLDDFIAADFDSAAHGFVGGATPNVENQQLPIQISREGLPPDVPSWGKGTRITLEAGSTSARSASSPSRCPIRQTSSTWTLDTVTVAGSGSPLCASLAIYETTRGALPTGWKGKPKFILYAMGAVKTWRGPRFRGVCSSHDLGGCRMGEDPTSSVVDSDLRVHDTPGLYVFGGAVFPTCPGVNPTLTMWALCYRAAKHLVERLHPW